ncbi:hypothetical protein IKO70_09715 [bacterium]|nr:hypothetical protein [bacterium]
MVGKHILFNEDKGNKTHDHKQRQKQEQTDSEISGTLQNTPEKQNQNKKTEIL